MNEKNGLHYKTVIFISFENHYAPQGGLAAVMKRLPPIMSKSVKTLLITPLFINNKKTRQAIDSNLLIPTDLKGQVIYKGFKHDITLFRSTEFSKYENYELYLVRCDNFFLSGEDPYNDKWRFDSLIHDSYFFTKSIPVVLNLIKNKYDHPIILNLQDWETALVADIIPSSSNIKHVLTLHNPYDEYLPNDPQGRTILQFTIPKIQAFSTVSEHFAYELQNDVLQNNILSRRIKNEFQLPKLIGINNGNFTSISFPDKILDHDNILSEKLENRKKFNDILDKREEIIPKWGNTIDLMRNNNPIFLFFGRHDPLQKGFDVAAAAVYNLFKKKQNSIIPAFIIFSLIPSSKDLIHFSPMEELASEFSDNVMVFPNRFSEGFELLMKSANYVIMPSYYEPFGAANEGYASGTPVIGRATGGLIQQVCPKNFESLPEKIKEYISWYHDDLTKPTGYLYREHFSTETMENWQYLLSTDFSKRRSVKEPVDWRNPVFWSMVAELEKVLERVINDYKSDKESYSSMIINGINLFRKFSWEISAQKYRTDLYDIVW